MYESQDAKNHFHLPIVLLNPLSRI